MPAGALVFFYESTAPPFYAKLFRISNFLANDYDKESINRVYGKMLLTFKLSISKATLHVQGRWNRAGGQESPPPQSKEKYGRSGKADYAHHITKGQLFLKCPFGVTKSTKKPTKFL